MTMNDKSNLLEKAIVHKLQEDLPLVPRPYKLIADELGISEEELLVKIGFSV